VQPTRSSTWHSSASAISTVVTTVSTDDPLASEVTLPTPTLHVVFGGKHHGDIGLSKAFAPAVPSSIAGGLDQAAGTSTPHPPINREQAVPEHPHRIELGIDSLPNFLLIEPIPVAIDPVGDTAFAAWVPNLDINVTANSVVEALLLLKDRLESVYDDLNHRAHLTGEEKISLQMLHTYIAPKKPEWV
jgi:hypothetical protein